MRCVPALVVVAVAGFLGFHLSAFPATARPAGGTDVLVAPPGDNDEAGAYWNPGRMEGARILRPVVPNPVTPEPVPAAQ